MEIDTPIMIALSSFFSGYFIADGYSLVVVATMIAAALMSITAGFLENRRMGGGPDA